MAASRGEYPHLYGPVPSRRLGLSLGVDIVPFKICSYNCVYCQLGRTPATTVTRGEYVPVETVLAEIGRKVAEPGFKADWITLGGSGEPTLHSGVGRLITGIKALTAVPVAVLTNGSLFFDPAVRADVAEADLLLPTLTAQGNIDVARHIAGDFSHYQEAHFQEIVKMLGIERRLHHRPAELSGGEQQRVATARALVNGPAILLADEPTGNLDTENSQAVLEVLRGLNQRLGQTILMITHNPEAAGFAHRTVAMRDGRVVS